jgi:hypothetical protein
VAPGGWCGRYVVVGQKRAVRSLRFEEFVDGAVVDVIGLVELIIVVAVKDSHRLGHTLDHATI